MLIYETYCWFSGGRLGPLERERKRVCAALIAIFGLLYLHSDKAASFQTAIARVAVAVLHAAPHETGVLR